MAASAHNRPGLTKATRPTRPSHPSSRDQRSSAPITSPPPRGNSFDEPAAVGTGRGLVSDRALELLSAVKNGDVDPQLLTTAERQPLVLLLLNDGVSTPEIAQILRVSDRTIERDRKALRQQCAVAADPNLLPQMVGRLVQEAELSIQRIRRAIRKDDVPAHVKVDGEARCFIILDRLIERMQSLGYLPTAASRVQAEVIQALEPLRPAEEYCRELARIEQLVGDDQTPRVRAAAEKTRRTKKAVEAAAALEARRASMTPEQIEVVEAIEREQRAKSLKGTHATQPIAGAAGVAGAAVSVAPASKQPI
jgi:hypothetical protein